MEARRRIDGKAIAGTVVALAIVIFVWSGIWLDRDSVLALILIVLFSMTAGAALKHVTYWETVNKTKQ